MIFIIKLSQIILVSRINKKFLEINKRQYPIEKWPKVINSQFRVEENKMANT